MIKKPVHLKSNIRSLHHLILTFKVQWKKNIVQVLRNRYKEKISTFKTTWWLELRKKFLNVFTNARNFYNFEE